jgi:hypothetical protein
MPVNNVGNHAVILPSPSQPSEGEAGRGQPSHLASSLPLQSLRRASGAVASGLMGAVRQTSALTTAALLAVVSEAVLPGAEAVRTRPGVPPSRGTPYRTAPPPPPGAPPRKVMELPSPGTSGLRGPDVLPTDPMLVAGAVVATAMGVGALAAAGVAAYNRWSADRKTTE